MPFISATQFRSRMIRIRRRAWLKCVLSEWKIGLAICDLEFWIRKTKKAAIQQNITQTQMNWPLIGCSLVQSLETDVVTDAAAAAAGWWPNMFDGILCNFSCYHPICSSMHMCTYLHIMPSECGKVVENVQWIPKYKQMTFGTVLLEFYTEINALWVYEN